MFCAMLLCCAMLGDEPQTAGVTAGDHTVYESVRKKAGNDAGAQIKLALWCEAHDMTAERVKHLALAMLLDPSNALARGLSGLVAHHGRWGKPDEVGEKIKNDPAHQALIREYLERRARTDHKADAQMKLAAWCAQNGLKVQAQAHYNEVIRIDPSKDVAWKHLGYKKQGERWVKPEVLATEKLEAEHQKHADFQWKTRLEKLREGLESPHAARREKAQKALADVTDPRAVPMISRILAGGDERLQLAAVQVLGQIDGPRASNLLAVLAVSSPLASVRQEALADLTRRDPRDVVGRLINLVSRPFKYQVRQGNGPGSTGELFVDGEKFDIRRLYRFATIDYRLVPVSAPALTPPSLTDSAMQAVMANDGMIVRTPKGGTVVVAGMASVVAAERERMMAAYLMETMKRNQALQANLENDIRTVEAANTEINQVNDRVLPVLRALTGRDFGADSEPWQKWWTDQLGYVYQSSQPTSKPTYTDTVAMPNVTIDIAVPRVHSACFAAGTLVQTTNGPRAIESVQVGDLVLSENTTSGLLEFQPVVATHLNEPSPTLRIVVDDETIVATGIHRFWKAGKGWTMARDLKAGDRLRMVGGVIKIKSIEPDATQPVFNLDVALNRDFFVGKRGLLVHDFSFVQPVVAAFDREPELLKPAPAAPSSTAR
jgi:Pretoxin HINT domain/HEAT repeats